MEAIGRAIENDNLVKILGKEIDSSTQNLSNNDGEKE